MIRMKNFSLKILVLMMISLSFNSCKKNRFTQFRINYEMVVEIPSSTGINLPFNIFTPETKTNSEAQFEVNNTRKDLIEQIILEGLELEINSPNNGNFNFLKSVELYISAEGLDDQKIAFKENLGNDNVRTIILETTNIDVQEYIKKDNFSLKLTTVTDEVTTSDYEIIIKSSFFIDAKLRRGKK